MNEGSSSSSSSLPYEIRKEREEQEKTGGKKYAAMKRVEAFIAAEKTDKVVVCARSFKLTGNIL